MKKYLASLSPATDIVEMTKVKQWNYCFVKFANLEDAQKFRETVHGNVYKKKKVFVKDCITSAEIQEKKRKREEELGLTG